MLHADAISEFRDTQPNYYLPFCEFNFATDILQFIQYYFKSSKTRVLISCVQIVQKFVAKKLHRRPMTFAQISTNTSLL